MAAMTWKLNPAFVAWSIIFALWGGAYAVVFNLSIWKCMIVSVAIWAALVALGYVARRNST